MSAAPMGSPGWPLLAFSTASTARKRMALAIESCATFVAMGVSFILSVVRVGSVGARWADGGS